MTDVAMPRRTLDRLLTMLGLTLSALLWLARDC